MALCFVACILLITFFAQILRAGLGLYLLPTPDPPGAVLLDVPSEYIPVIDNIFSLCCIVRDRDGDAAIPGASVGNALIKTGEFLAGGLVTAATHVGSSFKWYVVHRACGAVFCAPVGTLGGPPRFPQFSPCSRDFFHVLRCPIIRHVTEMRFPEENSGSGQVRLFLLLLESDHDIQ